MPAGEGDRAREQRAKLRPVFVGATAAVLVVYANEERDQLERSRRTGVVDSSRELVGGPSGVGDDRWHGNAQSARAKHGRKLHRPAFVCRHTFADRVRVTERENAYLGRRRRVRGDHGVT